MNNKIPDLLAKLRDAMSKVDAGNAENIDLTASASYMASDVADKLGDRRLHRLNTEGYPGGDGSFYANRDITDPVQDVAIKIAREAFQCEYANVQCYSASIANTAVMLGLYSECAEPQNRLLKIISADTGNGGHFTHAQNEHITSKFADKVSSIPLKKDSSIDYDALARSLAKEKPDVLMVGGSSNIKQMDFEKLHAMCAKHKTLLWVDASHHAGYMLAGLYPHPFPAADIITCSMHKSFPGPRTGLILAHDKDRFGTLLDKAVFPGVLGEPNVANMAATAAALGLVQQYQPIYEQTYKNAKILARELKKKGFKLLGDGTETQIVLIDLSKKHITGKQAADFLADIHVLSNQMPIPSDRENEMSGLRFGTFGITQQFFTSKGTEKLGAAIGDALNAFVALKQKGKGKAYSALLDKYNALISDISRNRHR